MSRKAVVDVGSNSVLLLVEEQIATGWKPILEKTWVTALGAGTKETGLLSDAGIQRTLAALKEAFTLAHQAEAESIIAAATMAARIARNTQDFQNQAQSQETPVSVLTGEQEAQLGFEAVAYDAQFETQNLISIIDVGGQSTELVTAQRGQPWQIFFRRSFGIGSLALRGASLKPECPSAPEILQAVVDIDDTIGLCYRKDKCGAVITLGATGTNLVTIREHMADWEPDKVHGAWLDFGEISCAAGDLMKLTEAERSKIVGMEPGREATLPAGVLILERFLDAIGAPGCYVSVRGWRHALLERGLPKES